MSLSGGFLRRSRVALSIPRCLLLSLLPSSAQSPLGSSSTSSCPNKFQYTVVQTRMQPPCRRCSRFIFAFMSLMFPSWNRYSKGRPCPPYFLATQTTSRRFFSTSRRLVSPSPVYRLIGCRSFPALFEHECVGGTAGRKQILER